MELQPDDVESMEPLCKTCLNPQSRKWYYISILIQTKQGNNQLPNHPSYSTSANAAPAAATNPPIPTLAATAGLLVVAVELLLVVEESVKLGAVTVLVVAVTPVPLTQTPLFGPAADELNVMSAQLYRPPLGSPLVCTWRVAFEPSVTFVPSGRVKPVMQKWPRPCSVRVGRRMVLNELPTSFPKPIRTSTLASTLEELVSVWFGKGRGCVLWPMVRAISPPLRGHRVRLEEGVSKEPQGKVPSLSSSNPRAAG
jgi:hypothetical protein